MKDGEGSNSSCYLCVYGLLFTDVFRCHILTLPVIVHILIVIWRHSRRNIASGVFISRAHKSNVIKSGTMIRLLVKRWPAIPISFFSLMKNGRCFTCRQVFTRLGHLELEKFVSEYVEPVKEKKIFVLHEAVVQEPGTAGGKHFRS